MKYRAWFPTIKEIVQVTKLNFNKLGHVDHIWASGSRTSIGASLDVVEGIELLSFSGMEDMNGNDVYAGHILKGEGGHIVYLKQADGGLVACPAICFGEIGELVTASPVAYLKMKSWIKDSKIIGDIYTTPHLLNEKEKS